jgi:hypothetical protein
VPVLYIGRADPKGSSSTAAARTSNWSNRLSSILLFACVEWKYSFYNSTKATNYQPIWRVRSFLMGYTHNPHFPASLLP